MFTLEYVVHRRSKGETTKAKRLTGSQDFCLWGLTRVTPQLFRDLLGGRIIIERKRGRRGEILSHGPLHLLASEEDSS